MFGDVSWSDWAVLLEAADEQGASTIDPDGLRQLVRAWPGPAPTSLYSPSRYALQVTVRATDPPAALALAMLRWTDARRRSGLPAWDLVRAEVLTSTELERELEAGECSTRADTDARLEPTPERGIADELLSRALNDSVTGLPNREMFLDDVRRALAIPLVGSDVRAVVTVALHSSGGCPQPDELLAEIGQCLAAAVRRGDTVARVGVAEFAALVTLPVGDHTDGIAERFLRCVIAAGNRHRRPLRPNAGMATASIGDDPDTLMTMAEADMDAARAKDADSHRSARLNGL